MRWLIARINRVPSGFCSNTSTGVSAASGAAREAVFRTVEAVLRVLFVLVIVANLNGKIGTTPSMHVPVAQIFAQRLRRTQKL
jgi:hypothetical protein